jgi:hypothetical protein
LPHQRTETVHVDDTRRGRALGLERLKEKGSAGLGGNEVSAAAKFVGQGGFYGNVGVAVGDVAEAAGAGYAAAVGDAVVVVEGGKAFELGFREGS